MRPTDVVLPTRLCSETQAVRREGLQHKEGATLMEGAAWKRADTTNLPASPPGPVQPKTQVEAEP